MTYWITSINESRLDDWDRILGMDQLPVTTHRPMMIRRGGRKRPYFMIDATALTMRQRMRLVGWVWKSQRVTAVNAAAIVEAGVLVDGADCEVVEPVGESPPAPFNWGAYAFAG